MQKHVDNAVAREEKLCTEASWERNVETPVDAGSLTSKTNDS